MSKTKTLKSEKRSPYRMGWIMVIFDLPVEPIEARRAATKFRHWLLDDGYIMLQYSVYVRPCVSYEHIEKHRARATNNAPQRGFVKILFFTDKQWQLGINIVGQGAKTGNRKIDPEVPKQILFW